MCLSMEMTLLGPSHSEPEEPRELELEGRLAPRPQPGPYLPPGSCNHTAFLLKHSCVWH
jgi:hypothetical protein